MKAMTEYNPAADLKNLNERGFSAKQMRHIIQVREGLWHLRARVQAEAPDADAPLVPRPCPFMRCVDGLQGVIRYTPEHPVARWIADGDSWVMAWVGQMCTPWGVVSQKTGISMERIDELDDGEEPTDEEVEELAALWWTTPTGLRKSIEDARPAMEVRRAKLAALGIGPAAQPLPR